MIRYNATRSNLDVMNIHIYPSDLTDELKLKAEKKGLIQEWGEAVEFDIIEENGKRYGKLI